MEDVYDILPPTTMRFIHKNYNNTTKKIRKMNLRKKCIVF